MPSPIRLARERDLGLLRSMMTEFYAESGYVLDPALTADALASLVRDPALGRLWVIESGDGAAGYIAVTFGFSLEYYGRDAFVDDQFLRPAFRGAGLGTRVLELVEHECRSLDVRALHLEVERANRAAQSLYHRRGFRDNDRQLLSKRLLGLPTCR